MPTLILASASRYRARVLRNAGYDLEVRRPSFDEAANRAPLLGVDPLRYALELATGKADSVPLGRGEVLVAADQVGVLDTPAGPVELTQQPDVESAVAQLCAMSGTTHRLVNAVVARRLDPVDRTVRTRHAFDVHRVSMASFDAAAARAYVERFRPFDTAGSYRIEDDAGLVADIDGSGDDGVTGMPLATLRRLLIGWDVRSNEPRASR